MIDLRYMEFRSCLSYLIKSQLDRKIVFSVRDSRTKIYIY